MPQTNFVFDAERLLYVSIWNPISKLPDGASRKPFWFCMFPIKDMPVAMRRLLKAEIKELQEEIVDEASPHYGFIGCRSNRPPIIVEKDGKNDRLTALFHDIPWMGISREQLLLETPVKLNVSVVPNINPLNRFQPANMIELHAVGIDSVAIENKIEEIRQGAMTPATFEEEDLA